MQHHPAYEYVENDLLDKDPRSFLFRQLHIVEVSILRPIVAMQQFRDRFTVAVGMLPYIH